MPVLARDRKSKSASDKPSEVAPIDEAKMLGLPEGVTIGNLHLVLTCPKIRDAARIQDAIYVQWPDVILYAATGDVGGKGIDPAQVANFWNQNAKASAERAGMTDFREIDRRDIAAQMGRLALSIVSIVPQLCDTLWPVCSATPNLHWPRPTIVEAVEVEEVESDVVPDAVPESEKPATVAELPEGHLYFDDALLDNLSIPDFADLLRAVLCAMGGYPGDVASRFP